jgi:hypothetical protein
VSTGPDSIVTGNDSRVGPSDIRAASINQVDAGGITVETIRFADAAMLRSSDYRFVRRSPAPAYAQRRYSVAQAKLAAWFGSPPRYRAQVG